MEHPTNFNRTDIEEALASCGHAECAARCTLFQAKVRMGVDFVLNGGSLEAATQTLSVGAGDCPSPEKPKLCTAEQQQGTVKCLRLSNLVGVVYK